MEGEKCQHERKTTVGVEKAVVVPKVLFGMMMGRLREFSASDKYKVQWMSSWDARWTLQRFLSNRCSKEFLALYLAQEPDILKRISEPGLSLSAVPEVDLAVRLHEFGLLSEENRGKFVETVSNYAIEGEDVYALKDTGIQSVFTGREFDELVNTVRTELLPKLREMRRKAQSNYDSAESPDEHMQNILELFSTLKERFGEDEDAVKLIDRETVLANRWIAATEAPEPKVSPRTLGAVEPSEEKHGTRSIFDDIGDDDE
jgi:uncharacterized protein (UPF0305 family)